MTNYLICYIICMLGLYADNCVLVSAFPLKKKRASKLLNAFLVTCAMLPLATCKILFNQNTYARNICLVLLVVMGFLYLYQHAEGPAWQKALFIVLQEITFFSGELLVVLSLYNILQNTDGIDYTSVLGVYMVTLVNLVDLILYLFVLQIWRRIVNKHFIYNLRTFLGCLLFPLSQIFFFYANSQDIIAHSEHSSAYSMIGLVISFITDGLLLGFIIKFNQYQELTRSVQEIKTAWQLEHEHYREIEARRDELARVRHDMKEHLIVMQELLNAEKYDQIRIMLDTLNESVDRTSEHSFCADPVVNAILSEYQKRAQENNIDLQLDIQIPRPLELNPVIISSLFSNMLRNSIAAVMEPNVSGNQIQFKAILKGNYLHIKSMNPYAPGKVLDEKRKHYGLKILQDAADRLYGSLNITREDGIFTVTISIMDKTVADAVEPVL